jgi:hypothetical protein
MAVATYRADFLRRASACRQAARSGSGSRGSVLTDTATDGIKIIVVDIDFTRRISGAHQGLLLLCQAVEVVLIFQGASNVNICHN